MLPPALHGLPGCGGCLAFLPPRLQTNAISLPLIIALLGDSGLQERLEPSLPVRSVRWKMPTDTSGLLSAAYCFLGKWLQLPSLCFLIPLLDLLEGVSGEVCVKITHRASHQAGAPYKKVSSFETK